MRVECVIPGLESDLSFTALTKIPKESTISSARSATGTFSSQRWETNFNGKTEEPVVVV